MFSAKRYVYYLPDENNNPREFEASVNSLIIIGANGSGKSKLGAWMERRNGEEVHRIGAQRSLNFSEHVPLKSYEEAEGEFFYGGNNSNHWSKEKLFRWGPGGREETTRLIDDYDATLSALLAQQNIERHRFFDACRKAEEEGRPNPHTPQTVLDKLYAVWREVFPHRGLIEEDAKFSAVLDQENEKRLYPGTQMSDGERSVLYLAAQVLCVPEDKTLIIDEPEVHLHPSLMGRLWRALESMRPDCLFVFITHDVQFAALHKDSPRIWVKSFDGVNWDWDSIPDSDLPEQLLLELLGNRKNVLFVEGESNSYDVRLYSALYPDFYVVPSGGCSQVIANTKAFVNTDGLHSLKACGLIDRDYRSDEEIEALERKGVFSIAVAEVENLFLVEPLLRVVAEHFACSNVDEVVSNVIGHIVNERFRGQIGRQIRQAAVATLKAQLSALDLGDVDGDSVSGRFKEAVASIVPEEELERQKERFEGALDRQDYDEVLRLFNAKDASGSVGHFFGVDNKRYKEKVIGLLTGEARDKVLDALRPFVPEIPA